jgi:hypothetical protein
VAVVAAGAIVTAGGVVAGAIVDAGGVVVWAKAGPAHIVLRRRAVEKILFI